MQLLGNLADDCHDNQLLVSMSTFYDIHLLFLHVFLDKEFLNISEILIFGKYSHILRYSRSFLNIFLNKEFLNISEMFISGQYSHILRYSCYFLHIFLNIEFLNVSEILISGKYSHIFSVVKLYSNQIQRKLLPTN